MRTSVEQSSEHHSEYPDPGLWREAGTRANVSTEGAASVMATSEVAWAVCSEQREDKGWD